MATGMFEKTYTSCPPAVHHAKDWPSDQADTLGTQLAVVHLDIEHRDAVEHTLSPGPRKHP